MKDNKGANRRPGSRATPATRKSAAAQRKTPVAANGGAGDKPPANGKHRFDKRWLVFIPTLAIVWLAYTYAKIAVTLPPPTRIIQGAQGLQILDRNGNLIQDFGGKPGSGEIVPLDQVSPLLVNATVATEDAGFWSNPGVSPKGLARAVYDNLAFWKYGLFKGPGGSSITQQLAKNLYIKPEDRADRSLTRKLDETLYAFELTRRYSKNEILSWYLSTNNYGNGAYGINAASYRYFNKAPADLTLAEASLLAALPRAPAYFDPIANPDNARAGQTNVLGLMVRHGYIDQATMDATLAQPITLNEGRTPAAQASTESPAPHFAEYVRELLPALIGKDKVQGNLVVTTTLDLGTQAKAQDAVTSEIKQLDSKGVTNGALVAIDPATGEVLAMVGSPDFNDDSISGQVNNATSLNQPGSTMKPITYLTAFMDEGWTPSTPIKDEPIPWNDGVLGNADGWYRGNITVREALASSLNVPAVKTLQAAGLPAVVAMARKLGISTVDNGADYGSSFTLGAEDVSLLDMTYVYTTFANDGIQTGMNSVLGLPAGSRQLDPIAVLRVETADGKVLWEADHHSVRLTPAKETFYLTDILSDDSARQSMFGLNSPLDLPRPAAVKSGSSDETRDAWAIGYTPQLVAGVWVGNANNAPIPNGTSTYTAAPIWHSFMMSALDGQPVLAFTAPQDTQSAGLKQTPTSPPKQPTAAPSASPTPKATQDVENAGLKATPTPTRANGDRKTTPTPTQPTSSVTPSASSTPTPITRSGGLKDPTNTPPPNPTSITPPTATPTP
ncbi:MAG TPA: transglycosylase domain-containing protein [Dehalococcoidia bacterium]|nr:transglycosylase domain-containing protein [Dehalococcoidia bacterium]